MYVRCDFIQNEAQEYGNCFEIFKQTHGEALRIAPPPTNVGLHPMWRFHSYYEPAGKAQGIKRAVKPTTEGVNIFKRGYE